MSHRQNNYSMMLNTFTDTFRTKKEKENSTIENKYHELLFDLKDLKGETVIRMVKTRVNQSVFREMVLVNYNVKCAISNIDIPELLLASHILPWTKNEENR